MPYFWYGLQHHVDVVWHNRIGKDQVKSMEFSTTSNIQSCLSSPGALKWGSFPLYIAPASVSNGTADDPESHLEVSLWYELFPELVEKVSPTDIAVRAGLETGTHTKTMGSYLPKCRNSSPRPYGRGYALPALRASSSSEFRGKDKTRLEISCHIDEIHY